MSTPSHRGSKPLGRPLATEDAKRFYDHFGSKQDLQFYEAAPLERLLAHGDFGHAASVFEFGCGTGRLAERLLREHLPPDARYLGVDLSTTMTRLAAARLEPWHDRAAVRPSDGSPTAPLGAGECDRFVVTYVLDLLAESATFGVLREAHRVLCDGGKLCMVSTTEGTSPVSRVITALWRRVYTWRPELVGGCRPISLADVLDGSQWRTEHRSIVSSWGICSEVVVCRPVPQPTKPDA